MLRREFIARIGGAAVAAWAPRTATLVERLRDLGWIESRTVAIEDRWVEGRSEAFQRDRG